MIDPKPSGGFARRRAKRNTISIVCSRCALALAGMLALASSVSAQSSLADLSLEDLMQMDAGQVYGASERLQPVTEAPASVSFITAQEIARYGYRTLADILRGVRGMYVTNDRNYSYIGVRGFSKPGDYNSRILLLINGHRVNDNIYGQAEIGAEFGLDPAMFERVEIIRGPASSLYGDSAFFAVVNVITRSGASLGGTAVTVEAGTLGTQLLRASSGRRLANGIDFAVSGTAERSDGVSRLYFPAFDAPATNNGVAEDLDREGARQLYGRLIFRDLSITGAYGVRDRDVPTASSLTLFNQQGEYRERTTDGHALVDASYVRAIGATRVTLRGSFDRFFYAGTFPRDFAPDGTPTKAIKVDGVGSRWSVSAGVTRAFSGRQTIRAGVEFIDNVHQDQNAVFVDIATPVLQLDHSSTQHAIYIQDEIKLGRWFIVNAGLRYDRYSQFVRVTPRAALIVLPSSTQSLKYLYGGAFRAPNQNELNATYYGDGVMTLSPESIDTHEVVWERYISDRLRTSMSAYWYKADRLITEIADASSLVGSTFVNQGRVRARGLELEAQVRVIRESRALVSYAFQRALDENTGLGLTNSPHHVAKARISLPGPTPRSFVSVEAQYLSSRTTLTREDLENGYKFAPSVPGASTLNVNIIQPLGSSWELSGGIRNLFNSKYLDPVSGQHVQEAISQNGRTARIGLTWKLWQQ
jgi:iron complex outermembrane receptor protein